MAGPSRRAAASRAGSLLLLALVLAGAAPASSPRPAPAAPSVPTLIHHNARLALRENAPGEALRLWFLRSAVAWQTGRVSAHDTDMHTVAWASLGELGLCQDGLKRDRKGAGLWPVALHNQMVRTLGRKPRRPAAHPFQTLDVGRQQRFVAVNDVLSRDELETLRLAPGRCLLPWRMQVAAGELPWADRRDRDVAARVLRHLLEQAGETMHSERVRGQSVVAVRLFDLDLQLTALAAREARAAARRQASQGRVVGLGRPSVEALRATAPTTTLDPESPAAQVLRASVGWPVDEWMALAPDRRQLLFDQAWAHAADLDLDTDRLYIVAEGILDKQITAGDGAEVAAWIARRTAPPAADARAAPATDPATDPAAADRQRAVWAGERGARLLGLGPEAGFGERAVVALHRGVDEVQRGELERAMRTLAFALQHAEASADRDQVALLARRWLAHVSGRFALTDELLTTLAALVPRRDLGLLLEDLLWRAALRADGASFDRGRAALGDRGSAARRVAVLAPLAAGDRTGFVRGLRRQLSAAPGDALAAMDRLVAALEREEAAVRAAHLPTLAALGAALDEAEAAGLAGRQARQAAELGDRMRAIREGLAGLDASASARDRAQALAPEGEVFVGALRLAPADPLPWPFVVRSPAPPSVFTPITLRPVEWTDASGALVYGWRLSG